MKHRYLFLAVIGTKVAPRDRMILAFAALLLQSPAIPQNWNLKAFSSKAEVTDTAAPETTAKVSSHALESSSNTAAAAELAGAEDLTLSANLPARDSRIAAISLSSVSSLQDRIAELRRRKWLALSIFQHSAAIFDAWSTRQAISTGRFQELNPVLRPFAGNSSLYATIQVAPLLLDYVGRRMMTSQHAWLRHTWWIPQVLSTTISLGSGAHNLSVR